MGGRANRTYKAAVRRVEKSWQYGYRDRKINKRTIRKLWIMRINAGVRAYGINYSRFVKCIGYGDDNIDEDDDKDKDSKGKTKRIILNRKMLADLAMNEPFSFKAVLDVVKILDNEKKRAVDGSGEK